MSPSRSFSLQDMVQRLAAGLLAMLAAGNAMAAPPTEPAQAQVFAVERAFAQTMADRDLKAFSDLLSEETIFFGSKVLRGKQQVVGAWKDFFSDPQAPFSWAPDQVEVLDSGTLALSTGLVKDPSGKVISRFTSIWRLEAPGRWRIIFDKGSPLTAEEQKAASAKP